VAFKYRLQKILELREAKFEEIKVNFQLANSKLREIQTEIDENLFAQTKQKTEITKTRDIKTIPLILNRIKFLQQESQKLEEDKKQATEEVEKIREKMIKAQQEVEILVKHSKKLKKSFDKEQQSKELNELNEISLIMKRLREKKEE